jgi:3-hydroxyanthranilate 3,4-dioxygenase
MAPEMGPIDLPGWLRDHRGALDRGEGATLIDGSLEALVVPGRGPRGDFHVNPVAELFYQLDGDISVTVPDGTATDEVEIRTGQLWLAPPGMPHSPQRPAGTVGLVVQAARDAGATEAFRWFCIQCLAPLHEIVVPAGNAGEARRPTADFHADEQARTCGYCGAVYSPPGG